MKMKNVLPTLLLAVAPVAGASAQGKTGLELKNLDRSARPQDDFYQFATGGWQKNNPLPAAYSRFGSFDQLAEANNKRINTILGDLQKKKYAPNTTEGKLAAYYRLAMDMERRNREGISPVKPLLDRIEKATSTQALEQLQLEMMPMGFGIQYGYGFGADEKNAKMNILNIYQGGLTLGQKDYYVNNDSATVAIREAYHRHIARMFQVFGFNAAEAQRKADAIYRIETTLALVSKSMTELRDPQANYHKMTLDNFAADYPHLRLEQLANAEGIDSRFIQDMVVGQPEFLAALDKVVATYTTDDLRAVMQWDVIMGATPYLSDEVREANFEFFGRTLSGRKEDYPLWKRVTGQVQGAMGEALGKMYCDRYFPSSSKKQMENLVAELQRALGERIDAQTWMSDTTKAAAHKKLDRFYVKIGYPNKWTDYSKLTIDPDKSYYENTMAVRKFLNDKAISEKAGKPVDRDEWHMTPQTVNAYYNPTTNEICFPAGILQYPFFDPKADDAFNLGAIGVVIGHEMTHGFDDQGRQYDADGNMRDWWTANDAKGFEQRAKLYADFFDSIEVLPGLHANGRFTLGENLADHGGLQVALQALANIQAKRPLKKADGFTPVQRFFLAYSGVWAQNITEQEIRNRVKTDPHSTGEWRVNGALPHIDEWYKAFDVKSSDKLFIPQNQRLQLW